MRLSLVSSTCAIASIIAVPLLMLALPRTAAQTGSVKISIDAGANRHPINPNVYGMAYASAAALADLNVPLDRSGGNNTSRYNWQLNADNRGNDWYFESIGDDSATAGERGDTFISTAKAHGAQAMLTIPMVGRVAKLGANRGKLCSFSQAKYGQQAGSDRQWFPDAGNGVLKSSGQNVTGNDPDDANGPADADFQRGWVQHLVGRWGKASTRGLRYYLLDNEPSIWHSTHRDIHPSGASMDEIYSKMVAYASMIKELDPSALVVGPEEWGWTGYLYSGQDQQYGSAHGWKGPYPDSSAHGDQEYLPWLLNKLHQHDAASHRRLLDVFTVHFYPQGGEGGNDTSAAKQLLRNQSTRSLWDANYVDQSWIKDRVMLIPRLRNWVKRYYPGTRIGITEYNWGAEGHINGATTQADILGIFGRESLDVAARWTTPDAATPTYRAIQLYRNYDGKRSAFGDTSVSDSVPNPDAVSSFAALRTSDGALTAMVINKQAAATEVALKVANFSGSGSVQGWQLTSTNAITRLPDLRVSGGTIAANVPAQSITLLVLARSR